MKKIYSYLIIVLALVIILTSASTAKANHAWGTYHWARTANPFNLKLGDNLSINWDSFLSVASIDWSLSTVLDTHIVSGSTSVKTCKSVLGTVQVCNSTYGKNGWLGIASIWADGSHITQGTVKMNDSYFKTPQYNTSEWRQLVLCQEIGHTLGLDHQDEDFANSNLGTCMDYTSAPSTNQHPNAHDYEMLETIYSHLDSTNTSQAVLASTGQEIDHNNQKSWGKLIKESRDKRTAVYELDLGNNQKIFTFVVRVI